MPLRLLSVPALVLTLATPAFAGGTPANPAAAASGMAGRGEGSSTVYATGMGTLGRGVEANNLQCPPRGAPDRVISDPGSRMGITCAPTGAPPVLPLLPPTPDAAASPRTPSSGG